MFSQCTFEGSWRKWRDVWLFIHTFRHCVDDALNAWARVCHLRAILSSETMNCHAVWLSVTLSNSAIFTDVGYETRSGGYIGSSHTELAQEPSIPTPTSITPEYFSLFLSFCFVLFSISVEILNNRVTEYQDLSMRTSIWPFHVYSHRSSSTNATISVVRSIY